MVRRQPGFPRPAREHRQQDAAGREDQSLRRRCLSAIYLPKLEASAGINSQQLDAIVGAHLIDTDALRAADFDRFFLACRQALLELVEQAMGKRAQRDVDAGELTGGDEAPEAFAEEAEESDDPQDLDVLLVDNGE